MSTVTARRARHAAKNILRVVEFVNDPALQSLVIHKQNMTALNANGFVGVKDYSDAIAIKIEYDDASEFVDHSRVFIQPVRDGFVCQIRIDQPEDHSSDSLYKPSEVDRVNWLAEEWGTSVEDLLTSRPHLIERSSGGNTNRL